jgi:hypothetical protein
LQNSALTGAQKQILNMVRDFDFEKVQALSLPARATRREAA